MTEYDNTNRGALFKNKRKEADSHPDYTGTLNVGGVDYWISAWLKDSKAGKLLSLSVKPKEAKRGAEPAREFGAYPERASKPAAAAGKMRGDMDDEIPFAPEWR